MTDDQSLQLIPGTETAPGRLRLERLVREVYAAAYGARIAHLLPLLLGLEDTRGRLVGVIGAQPGDHPRRMFLEEYLDAPVEAVLSAILGAPVPRRALAEVGNLSAAWPGHARPLVSTMAAFLDGAGVSWAVFTATRSLRLAFRHMRLQLLDLGPADGRRLGERLADWGTYYDTDPRVTAVSVPAMRAAAALDPLLASRCVLVWPEAHRLGSRSRRDAA